MNKSNIYNELRKREVNKDVAKINVVMTFVLIGIVVLVFSGIISQLFN